ncbi:hypothetical protein GJ744_010717 [Endocarpon pusillum]|uniref:UBA domain-containing protein n=1 Tax=Endocarpon pusillum TaxID=364733 RepID=A0A8H7E3Z2_9EURO|nr:hypothetical protein GJ744_010717 [Endocarpon pusillum]
MLKPFRIRNLYFNSTDLVDCSGVVQITPQEYNQEIETTPEALLAYIDDDDGETITVGSSLELEQRLLEPPGRFSSWYGHLSTDDPPPLHIFDMQQSTRAAEAWRRYVIQHNQPSTPVLAQPSGPRLEKRKHDDYLSLLARFQVLELEVKLLKEAFKMHKITLPVQPHQPQQSVIANACKNSDLFIQSPPGAMHPTYSVSMQEPPIESGSQYTDNTSSNWCKQSELRAPDHHSTEDATVLSHNQNNLNCSQHLPQERKSVFPLFPQSHVRTLRSEPKSMRREASDGMAQETGRLCLNSTTHHNSREPSRGSKAETGSVSPETNHLDDPRLPMGNHLAEDNAAGFPEEHLPKLASLRQAFEDAESPGTASPSIRSQQSATNSLLDLEPEAEIARFPTIFQLEREDLHSVNSKGTNLQGPADVCTPLIRAKTVTSSNPAARLLQPFDPATERLAIASSQNSVPRRSGTEIHRRRPYVDQFSGTGRTLWEEFERPQRHSTAPRNSNRPESRRLDVLPSQPNPSVFRSQSLVHHQPYNHPHSRRLAPMQSALDLSGRQRNQRETSGIDQLRHHSAAAASSPNLVRRANTNSDHSRERNVRNCIRTLQEMGYKPHSRLPIYAEACDGKLSEAMKMAEEDEKATQETREIAKTEQVVFDCVQQLKSMGFGAEHDDEALKEFAQRVAGNVELAIDAMERQSRRDIEAPRDRLRRFMNAGMPGSFP